MEFRLQPRLTLQAGAGIANAGQLRIGDTTTINVQPGPLAVVAGAYRVSDGLGTSPFVLLTGALSFSTAETQGAAAVDRTRLTALDARFGLSVGKLFLNRLAPYVTARAFGGPVYWRYLGQRRLGTDLYHFQVGLGLVVRMKQIDSFVEINPLGARSFSSGLAYSF